MSDQHKYQLNVKRVRHRNQITVISREIKSIIVYLNGHQMKTQRTKFESLFTYLIQIWIIEGIFDCPFLLKAIFIIIISDNESNFQMEFP